MVPRADIIAVQQRHRARRPHQGVRGRRPFAPRRLRRHARRSGRHGAHPRPDRLHGARTRRSTPPTKRKKLPPAGLDLKAVDLSIAALRGEDHTRDPVRAALDAGDRPAGQDAGDAHPSRARDRRIWRHRRHRLDGGHRRADRRRHRGRARRRRGAEYRAAAGRLVHRRRARASSKTSIDVVGTGVRCRRGGRRSRHARRLSW